MSIAVKGVVLTAKPFKETDIAMNIFTVEFGKITVIAKHIRKSKKHAPAFLQPFSYSLFNLAQSKGIYYVDSAEDTQLFYNLRTDIDKLAIGQYFLEIINSLPQNYNENPELLRLLLNSLYLLSGSDIDKTIIKIVFELRFTLFEGYLNNEIDMCNICEKNKVSYWDFEKGFICSNCVQKGSIPLTTSLISAIKHIISSENASTYSFEMNKSGLAKLNKLSEKYVSFCLETEFKTLNFFSMKK